MFSKYFVVLCFSFITNVLNAGTSVLFSKGACVGGFSAVAHIADWYDSVAYLQHIPAVRNSGSDSVNIINPFTGKKSGSIPQVEETYAVAGAINTRQVTLAWTAFAVKTGLENTGGLFHLQNIATIVLQRAINARHAIKLIDELSLHYGLNCRGASFSVADSRETWLLEISGTGSKFGDIVWVARKVPDGYVSAHANFSRIGTFPLYDGATSLYSRNLFAVADAKKLYVGEKAQLSFKQVFGGQIDSYVNPNEARVWSIFSRIAPTMTLDFQYSGGVRKYDLPLWVKPAHKMSIEDIAAVMRNHFEGTPIVAIPNNRPIHKSKATYPPISGTHNAFSFIAQLRDWMPYPLGGVLWYGLGDNYFTCYQPIYCGANLLPPIMCAKSNEFGGWELPLQSKTMSASAQRAYLDYSGFGKQLVHNQESMERKFVAMQPYIDSVAAELYSFQSDSSLQYVSYWSTQLADSVSQLWRLFSDQAKPIHPDSAVSQEIPLSVPNWQ